MRRKHQDRLVMIIGLALLAGFLTGCDSSRTTTTATATATDPSPSKKAPTGTLITIVHDVPICNAISAAVVVENLNFTESQGGAVATYLNTT
ncbi:MAG TPA: hypothetical protein VEN79_18660, partial [Terriglobia bacterium]|nr:hypothetical protein [Terriglobia bacterium]